MTCQQVGLDAGQVYTSYFMGLIPSGADPSKPFTCHYSQLLVRTLKSVFLGSSYDSHLMNCQPQFSCDYKSERSFHFSSFTCSTLVVIF